MLVDLCDAPSFSTSTEDFGIGLSFEKPHDVFGEPQPVLRADHLKIINMLP